MKRSYFTKKSYVAVDHCLCLPPQCILSLVSHKFRSHVSGQFLQLRKNGANESGFSVIKISVLYKVSLFSYYKLKYSVRLKKNEGDTKKLS